MCRKQLIIALYFGFDNEVKFYNLGPGVLITLSAEWFTLSMRNPD